jgi:hypothetical protein
MARADPKYTAAAFRKLLAKLAAAKAEARPAIEAQIKEIYELASPGFGGRFILRFRNQRRSREDAIAYVDDRNRILAWLLDFAAAKRKPYIEKARQEKADTKAHRNRQMVDEYLRMKPSWDDSDTELKASIGRHQDPPLKRSAAIVVINRGLRDRGLKPAKRRKA